MFLAIEMVSDKVNKTPLTKPARTDLPIEVAWALLMR